MHMQALRFHGPGDLRTEDVSFPEPAPGEVLVQVESCGVCGSDLHFIDGSARTGKTPITLGHETAGEVTASRDEAWQPGDQVVVAAGITCGSCSMCASDRETLCEELAMVGIDIDGGLAEYVLVPGSAVVRRPSHLEAAIAALAVDAGATAFHAVNCKAGVRQGDAVLVMGCGGLGSFGVQFAKMAGAAPVIAVDTRPDALERAIGLGADETILSRSGLSIGRETKMMTDGGVDVALEFVGKAATLDATIKSLRPGGTAIAVGVGNEPLVTIPPVLWANNDYALVGSFGSHQRDIEQVLALLAQKSIQPPPIEDVAFDEAAERIVSAAEDEPPHGRLVVSVGS